MTREQPKQAPPPVQRLRVRYAKRGRLRFTSHRDFSRAFERAVFRARLPMAYSSGFNPHPRISYAGAAPTGSASEAEYLELALADVVDPAAVHAALDEALPDGLDIVEVLVSPAVGLTDLLEASHWQVALPVPRADAEAAVASFLAAEEVMVQRLTKKGVRDFDSRSAVHTLAVAPDPDDADDADHLGAGDAVTVDLVLRHVEPMVRPDDVLKGLASVSGLTWVGVPLLTRLSQGPLDAEAGTIGDPLRP